MNMRPGSSIATKIDGQTATPKRVNGRAGKMSSARPTRKQTTAESWTDISADEGRTDIANARRFITQYGDDYRYCHLWQKAVVWDGTRWKIDDDAAAVRMATKIADGIWYEVAATPNKEAIQFAKDTSRSASVNAFLKLAGSMRPVRVDELDVNAWLLNCENGTVDLRTGELREHRREDNITKFCPTRFNPVAATYHFDKFLDGVFGGSSTLIDFLKRLFGYCLTGVVSEQILPVFYGGGSNGKSTLLNAILDVLGTDYCSAAPPSLLMEKKNETHPTELATLFGKRLVIAQESSQGARLAESVVKQLTGGDIISARRMREDFWTFAPSHKIVLVTNHKPRVRGTDVAIWRRIVLLPFNQRFWNPAAGETGPPEMMQDKSLSETLMAEREGILAWMIQGCLEWQRSGLQIPDEVRAATAEYRSESDTVGRFVANCCLTAESTRVKFSTFYDGLARWCSEIGDSIPSKKFVGEWLRDHDFAAIQTNGRWFLGIALKADISK